MILHVENGTSYLKGIQEKFKNYITMRYSDKLDAVASLRRYESGSNMKTTSKSKAIFETVARAS
jgi:hypothetical protein